VCVFVCVFVCVCVCARACVLRPREGYVTCGLGELKCQMCVHVCVHVCVCVFLDPGVSAAQKARLA